MKVLGYWIVAIGAIYLIWAFNMDVSGNEAFGRAIANIDRMETRQNHIIVACVVVVIGVGFSIAGHVQGGASSPPGNKSLSRFQGERDLSHDSYRLFLARKHRIERNDLFDRFVTHERTFETLDEALAFVHQLESEPSQSARRKPEEIDAANAQVKAESDKEFSRVLPWFIGAATLIAIFIFWATTQGA